MKSTISYGLLIVYTLILFQCNQKVYPIKIQHEGNIKIVHNPDYPKFRQERYEFERVFTIGLEEGDDNYIFSRIKDIKVDTQDNIYVLDFKNYRIQVYNIQGNYIRTIGNKGQGPGEFINPSYIDLDEKNNIYVSEFLLGKTTCFDNHGKYIRNIDLKGNYLSSNIADFYCRNNSLYFVILKFRDNPKPDEHPVFFEMIKVDMNGKFLKTIQSFENIKSENYKNRLGTLDCEPRSVWTIDQTGKIYIGFSDKYEICVYGNDGNLIMKIIQECEPVKISEQDKEEDLVGIPESQRSKFIFPKYRPFFDKMTIDDSGNLWIQRFGKDKSGLQEFDIFSEEGIYLRKVNIDITPQYIKNGHLYAITETINGYPSVSKIKMKIM